LKLKMINFEKRPSSRIGRWVRDNRERFAATPGLVYIIGHTVTLQPLRADLKFLHFGSRPSSPGLSNAAVPKIRETCTEEWREISVKLIASSVASLRPPAFRPTSYSSINSDLCSPRRLREEFSVGPLWTRRRIFGPFENRTFYQAAEHLRVILL